ncbi:MAG: rod shape-determining protein MreC [Candidatus Aadella gelida]|nr:rod shape-determining protein MreC [Candidatus Aadella gelida]
MPRFYTKEKSWILTACIITLISLSLFFSNASSFIKNISVVVTSVPVKSWSTAGKYFRKKLDLEEENSELKKTVAELSLKNEQFKELRKENKRLRNLVGFNERFELDTVAAGVIARDPNDWVGSFILDKGADDGLKKDAAVCSSEGLLGKIAETSDKTSSVILISHPAFRSGGKIKNTHINGIVVGTGAGKAKMLYLPVDAEIREGSIVMTSDYSQIFPKGIIMGRIISVGRSRTGLYKYADIEPSANPLAQEEVLCVR